MTAGTSSPAAKPAERVHTRGDFAREEMALANRNSGMPLEALRHEVTPVGLHFLLAHFDVPYVAAPQDWRVAVEGQVEAPLDVSLAELQRLPAKTLRVTLECAGNGRANVMPRWQTMPWEFGGVGTAEWTGTPLRHVLERARLTAGVREIAFLGADRGFDAGIEHEYGRSLAPARALEDDVLLAWAMNGAPLPPQHGAPLRLVVPGWYGMASVKWLRRIVALDRPFDGYQQATNYHFRQRAGEPGIPVTALRVKALMAPPGIPHWYSRKRVVEAGPVTLTGRAWSGAGVPVTRVEVAIDGAWCDATLDPPAGRYAWRGWRFDWQAQAGEHTLVCCATDADGNTQPLDPPWDQAGMGNNAVQRVAVTVR